MLNSRTEKEDGLSNPIKVGEIFCVRYSFYDEMVTFYQVKEIRGKIAVVQQIDSTQDFIDDKSCARYRSAVKDKFVENSQPLRKKIQSFQSGGLYFSVDRWRIATLWDGKPCLVTI
jgi:hypothetical protein